MGINQKVPSMGGGGNSIYMFRDTDIEKRQLFLRSYQFRRKRSVDERVKRSFFRVKRVILLRLRSARKIRRIVWLKLKLGLFACRRKRSFFRLHDHTNTFAHSNYFW